MVRMSGTTGEHSQRVLKKTTFSPAQPRRAKTRRSTGKAAASNQRWFFQACSCTLSRMARMSPPLRASNEGLLRPRVARAQGTHRAIPPLLADFFSIL
jgi:hypothetical protein